MRNVKRTLMFFAIVLLSLVALTSASVLAATPKVADNNVNQTNQGEISESMVSNEQSELSSSEPLSSETSSDFPESKASSEEKSEVESIETRLKGELSEKGQVELTDQEARVLAGSNHSGFRAALPTEDGELKVEGSKLGTIYYARGEVGRYYDDIYVTKINGKIVFCLEPMTQWAAGTQYVAETMPEHIYLENKATFTPGLDGGKVTIDKETRLKLEQIVQYGYYELPSRQNAGFTQALLWENMGFKLLNEGYIAENQDAYSAFKQQVNAKIAAWKNTPSWNNQSFDLRVGESLTLKDTNGVFEKLALPSHTRGVRFERKGNLLTLTATKSAQTGEFLLKQAADTLTNPVSLLYKRPGAQTFATLFFRDPVSAVLNLNILPTVGTTLTDTEGEKQVDPLQEVVLKDVVRVSGATIGKWYDLNGTLKIVETGEDLLYNGNKVTSSTRVQATAPEFLAELFFTFDARSLRGRKVVAFEDLYTDGRRVASEAKLENPSQTVRIRNPKIHTTATVNGKKEVEAGQPYIVEDKVRYEDFSPGKYYRLTGLAAYPDTQELIKLNGAIPKGTATFKAESENGEVTVPIHFESTEHLSGKSAVILEEAERLLVSKDATENELKNAKGETVAEHKDYKDHGQTVNFRPTTPPSTPPTPPTGPELPKTGEENSWFIMVMSISMVIVGVFILAKPIED